MTASRLLRIVLFAFLFARVIPASCQQPIDNSIQHLAQVSTFAFGGVGIAGITSQGEKDFRIIMSQPPDRALASFEELYKTGNLQAKGYALAGIRALNPARFKEIYLSVVTSNDPVRTMHGCLIGRTALKDVARQIDEGAYDPWLKAKPSPSKQADFNS
jgi:hypothetical protein